MDYARAYDEYWSRADRSGTHSFANPEQLVTQILAAAGMGRTVDLGCGMGMLVHRLLRRGVDAYGVDASHVAASIANRTAAGRFVVGDLRDLPFADGHFDTVVSTDCLEHLREEDVPKVLSEIHRVARRCVYLRIATRADRDGEWHLTVRPRAWWEQRLFEAGFRKHPAYYEVNDYEAIADDAQEITVLLEPIHAEISPARALADLTRERDLHMDMLRESGARSDAHVIRYQLAARFIRPGDTVLDAACGLGYGSHLMHSRSMAARTIGIDASAFAVEYAQANFGAAIEGLEFRRGVLPDCLADIADHSIDFVASFETLEHVDDPQRLIAEFTRVLKPSGRIVCSVPNDWSDETGADPNPHHHHVYTWPRLRDELRQGLIVEAAYEQTASRRKTGLPHARAWEPAPRRLRKHPPAQLSDDALPDCEWWLAVAMKDPRSGVRVPYVETGYPPALDAPAWTPTAFGRDYRNPWLVNGMVTIGHRLSDDQALTRLAQRVRSEAPPGSADAGAALCVIGYRYLSAPDTTHAAVARFASDCVAYVESPLSPNPHEYRWRISLWFVLGKLWQSVGDFAHAQAAFERCASMDPLVFSPLIATKSVEARLQLAMLAVGRADPIEAGRQLRRGIDVAERALQAPWTDAAGNLDHPAEFALAELALIVERASSCAYALAHLDLVSQRPGQWWWQHRRDRATQLDHYRAVEAELVVKNASIHEQTSRIHALWREVQERQHAGATLSSEVHRLNEAIVAKDAAVAEVIAEVHRLNSVVRAKDDAMEQAIAEIHRLEDVVVAKDAAFPVAAAEIHRLNLAVIAKDTAIAEVSAEIARLNALVVAKDAHAAGLAQAVEDSRRALDETGVQHASVVSTLEAQVAQLHGYLADGERERTRVLDELRALRASRWHRLGEMLRNPRQRRSWSAIAGLGAQILRNRIRRPRQLPASTSAPAQAALVERPGESADAPTSYRINVPAGPEDRPHVVHVIANFMTGGSSRLVVDLIERLGLYRHTILTSFVPDPPAYRGAAVRVVGVASSIDAIRQAVAERPVALIHVHYWGEGDEPWYRHVLDALDGLGCPIIENVNTPVHPLRREGVARYVYVSRYVREHFGSSAYPEEVIYPGSDLSLFTRASAGAAVGDTIGMVYRLERDKLDDLSMEPFIEAVRARAGTRVLIVGGGTLLDPFQRRVREADVADRFTFTGYVAYHELPALYASMAVFAAPVWKESFGQVSSFAMSMGVPVAGYAVGAIPEIVDDPALVAPLHDSKGLARILCDLLDRPDLRAGIAARNLERVHALHSVDAMVARYRDLYAEVLETHV